MAREASRETIREIAANMTANMIANGKEYSAGRVCLVQSGNDATLAEEALAEACKLVGNHFGHQHSAWQHICSVTWCSLRREVLAQC